MKGLLKSVAWESCDLKVVFILWLFCTVTSAVFREIRASLLPASLEYTAYGHWGPYTLHTFKSDIEEQTPPQWLQSTMESVSTLWLSFMQWLPEPPASNLTAHCAKSISLCWQQSRLVVVTCTCGGVPSRQKKMSKREMKWPPNSRWTWLNQQWKSMSWKEVAGKINEGIIHWPMNFVPFLYSRLAVAT